jgi:hypothetical protein
MSNKSIHNSPTKHNRVRTSSWAWEGFEKLNFRADSAVAVWRTLPALQERHTLRALTKHHSAGLISAEVAATLRQTYEYLRRLEHYLQMEQGSQTHTLPRAAAQQHRLARHFGYGTWEEFYHDYMQRTDTVHTLFTAAFEGDPAVFAPPGIAGDVDNYGCCEPGADPATGRHTTLPEREPTVIEALLRGSM